MTENGRLALVFDDGYRSDFAQLRPVLDARDAPASFAIVSEWVARDGHLDVDQLRDLVDLGGEVLAHGRYHRVLRPHHLADDVAADARRIPIESHVFPENESGVHVGDEYELVDADRRQTVTVAGKGSDEAAPYVELAEPVADSWSASETVFRLPDRLLDAEIRGSGADLRDHGFEPAGFVFPYDAADVRAHRIARSEYGVIPNAAVRSLPNPSGTPAWNLRRYYLETDALTRVEIADYLDAVARDGGFGILAGHSDWDTVPAERVRFVIEAARDRGIELTTFSECVGTADRTR
ncbi:polysaccharide deacetylase [Salinarchaeum sp. Harcht-Bsk1]|uniref:polysaccharide deacetylase family protein n=1 Tax=Salinarchaeum sp. Harcht-Bsk1 TaxID=1333523 RepID=UPI0003422AC1|nr:polysaccharide deacetylase family protein [Salinarchaeum sp. Harcht-Bsk1]AGN02887.1 polysaccharide deacetylase [Salinarchaeum sp. Harcht-Bsk1]